MLTINIFFCMVLRTELLPKAKEGHTVDLAYLYYLPFCSVFTSKDNFHAQIVPLFLEPDQSFVNGIDLKEDLKRLVALYSALPDEIFKTGLSNFADHPPEDTSYLVTRLWDKHMPAWRRLAGKPKEPMDPEEEKKLIAQINALSESPELQPHHERDMTKMDYAVVERTIYPKKGKWLRFSEDKVNRALEHEKQRRMEEAGEPTAGSPGKG